MAPCFQLLLLNWWCSIQTQGIYRRQVIGEDFNLIEKVKVHILIGWKKDTGDKIDASSIRSHAVIIN